MTRMMRQRLWGLAIVALCAVILVLAGHGATGEDRDITPVLLLLPLGIYALTTRKYILYDRHAKTRRPEQRARAACPEFRPEHTKGVTAWQENAL